MKAVVERRAARSVSGRRANRPGRRSYEVEPHDFGVRPGVDADRLDWLAGETAGVRRRERTVRKLGRVIVPDVNLLMHAHNAGSRRHRAGPRVVGGADERHRHGRPPLGRGPWLPPESRPTRATVRNPLGVDGARARVRSWLDRPQTALIHPGDRHADILFDLLDEAGTAATLTASAHFAALAIEHQAELHSTDTDMARFPGLRWRNPLV